jgi:hypothetical protein
VISPEAGSYLRFRLIVPGKHMLRIRNSVGNILPRRLAAGAKPSGVTEIVQEGRQISSSLLQHAVSSVLTRFLESSDLSTARVTVNSLLFNGLRRGKLPVYMWL